MPRASDSGAKGSYTDSKSDALESRRTINLFEQWEEFATGQVCDRLQILLPYVPCCLLHMAKMP